jgi:ribosome-binding factor A
VERNVGRGQGNGLPDGKTTSRLGELGLIKKVKFKTQFDKRPVKDGVFPCDEFLPGDGVDPRYDYEAEQRNVVNRKALQLCAQIRDTLNLSISQFGDPLLREMYVDSVIPAPDSTQLLVTFVTEHNPDEVFEHVQKASGLIRSEVATGINRKRVPNLRYQVRNDKS